MRATFIEFIRMSLVLSFTSRRSILEIRGLILTGWDLQCFFKKNVFFPLRFPNSPARMARDRQMGRTNRLPVCAKLGGNMGTFNCSAAAQWAVALTAVHVDATESDAEVRELNFCYDTALEIIFRLFRNLLLSI